MNYKDVLEMSRKAGILDSQDYLPAKYMEFIKDKNRYMVLAERGKTVVSIECKSL